MQQRRDMQIQKVYIGGWFQRTTLHLSEIHAFLESGKSPLRLDQNKLRNLHKALKIRSVSFISADLDRIDLVTASAVMIKIYEDGLITLSREPGAKLDTTITDLSDYYEKTLSPAISYLFSLGAPLPKELANIKTIYPYFVVLKNAKKQDIETLLKQFNQKKFFEIITDTFGIYRGDTFYVINNKKEPQEVIERFIDEQIFMREFKAQLHRYLNLHRIIWQKIADVKERGEIRGSDIVAFKNEVESYAKTITLIDTRIRQMGAYIKTREVIFKESPERAKFVDVLQFKYETLRNTSAYIQELWSMTSKYVDTTLKLFEGIQAKSTEASVKNLAVITAVGVGATLIGLFTQKKPEFTSFGVLYFILLLVVGYSADKFLKWIYKRRMYTIKDIKAAKDIS